jgi:hypothetical protein
MLRKASATTKRYLFNGHELSDPYNWLNDEIITKLMEFISFLLGLCRCPPLPLAILKPGLPKVRGLFIFYFGVFP